MPSLPFRSLIINFCVELKARFNIKAVFPGILIITLNTKDRQFDNFVVTGGTVSCHCDNWQCHQWRQSCQIGGLFLKWFLFRRCVGLTVYLSKCFFVSSSTNTNPNSNAQAIMITRKTNSVRFSLQKHLNFLWNISIWLRWNMCNHWLRKQLDGT